MDKTVKRDPSEAHGSGCWLAAVLLLLLLGLPLAYVLSIGPVIAVVEATDVGRNEAEAFYGPVIWLHDHTPLKVPLERYAALWGWH